MGWEREWDGREEGESEKERQGERDRQTGREGQTDRDRENGEKKGGGGGGGTLLSSIMYICTSANVKRTTDVRYHSCLIAYWLGRKPDDKVFMIPVAQTVDKHCKT